MRIKLFNIKGCNTCEQVCIALARDEEDDYIEIFAWHKEGGEGGESYYQYERIDGDESVLLRIIADFSELSANEFANSFKF